MKITKYVHSCLLVETDERVGIFDPGNYSYNSGLLDISSLPRLDDILITHEHEDHFYLPFVKELVATFPDVLIHTNDSIKKILEANNIHNYITANDIATVSYFRAPHESMAPLLSTMCENVGIHYLNSISHPGDSHHFNETKAILALPIAAPWGTLAMAAEVGTQLKPKYIIPIHDFQLSETARNGTYQRLEGYFKQLGITFLSPVDGTAQVINL